ncbi:MAG TPA: hypothetical protein VK897_24185 [Anaerolineales bacterium]|nr:hypothetical protein [Anaerolineales bacterium]
MTENDGAQTFDAPLPPGDLDKDGLIFGGDFQRYGQEFGELPRRPALPRFHFPDGKYTAAGALRQLFLGQIQLLATAFQPLAETQGDVLLARGKAGCLRIARSHFPGPFEFESSRSDS